jgi:hypothetical protein
LAEHYTGVPKAIFNTEVDTVAFNFLKRPDLPDTPQSRADYASALLSIGEALMIAPRVTFKVYGENVVLAVLARVFGAKAIEQLVDEGALEFVLWRPLIVTPEEKLLTQGLSPLAYGNNTNAEHSDPSASCTAGMKWCPNLDRRDRRALARRVAKRMMVTPEDAPKQAVEAVMAAYRNGLLRDMGFDPEVTEDNLEKDDRYRLVKLANDLTESAILFEREWDLYEGESTWATMLKVAEEVRSSGKVANTVEEVLRAENLPSIRNLLLKRSVTFPEILEMRRRQEVKDFQEWLWTRPDPADAKSVVESYAAVVAKGSKEKLADRSWFQAARVLGVAFAGGAAGAAIGGPVGAAAGAAAGFVAGNVTAAGVSYVDLFIDKVTKGRNPRRFAALLRDKQILSDAEKYSLERHSSS